MNLTEPAFKARRVVFLVLTALLAYGALSYFTLPASEDPEIIIREATVTTVYPGLNPERVEQLITRKLEDQIRKIPELKEIRSTSTTGLSIIHVEIQDRYFTLDDIWTDLRNKIDQAIPNLPEGTQTPQVNDEFGDVAVITLALTADGFDMAALNDMSKHIRDMLYRVEGTKKIDILGVQEERIFLETSNARLAQLDITPDGLIEILRSQNIIRPGGEVDTGAKSFIIEPTGNFDTVKQIGETLISIPETEDIIALEDIVTVRRDFVDPPERPSYFNGEQAVIFAISMLEGDNVLEYAPRVRAEIETIQQTLPIGYVLDIATYQADQVSATVEGVSGSVVQTLVIVLAVVMIFLGPRTGIVVGAIVPFVMLVTLAIMNIAGMALERMSLATLIISLGLLVDNGIVIAEDFKRRLEEGATREDALARCGRELSIPLLTSSLTTILVFLPLMLAEHVAGEYTRSISLVLTIALLTSWVLALTVTPTLCYYFLKVDPDKRQQDSKLMAAVYEGYRRFLHLVLRIKPLFLAAMFGLLFAAGWAMQFVPNQFFPDSDRSQVLVYVELPSHVSARTTDARMRDVFDWLKNEERFPDIESFMGHVGYGGPRFVLSLTPEDPASNTGFIVINTSDLAAVQPTIDALRAGFNAEFPDMFVRVSRMFLGPSDSSKLEIQVKGPDADTIYFKAQEIADILRAVPGAIDVRTDWESRLTKILVQVDQQRARRAGVTSEDIALSMQGHLVGEQVTEFREGDDVIPIVFRADADERFNLDLMRSMKVFSSSRGISVPLFQIADFESVNQYSRIERENSFRTVTIEAKNVLTTAEDMKRVVDPLLEPLRRDLPLNHTIEYDGVIAESIEASAALSANLPIVLGIIVVLLVAQFNSYRRALVIILTIPLALIGAVIGLLVTGSFFGFMVTLGLYSLGGIVINNAIVLIDRIDIERAAGREAYDAIVTASVMRLRPIVMTTVTTILGLLPLILSRDPLFYGMSNAMAFGLGVATILTLGVVPVLYALFYRIESPART